MSKVVENPKINFFWASDGRPVREGDKVSKEVAERTIRAVMECAKDKRQKRRNTELLVRRRL
ncbi:hypothetical protein [Enterococcus casseliflavus]|uniref:hypothetical protein n=1 Tax=Enterococcus casseliflavus TaxID=37734 RepID=UPI003D0D36F7